MEQAGLFLQTSLPCFFILLAKLFYFFCKATTTKKTALINLSVVSFILVLSVILVLFYKRKIMERADVLCFAGVYGVALVIYLFLLLGMHVFVFREPQYVSPSIMIISIARYAQPLFLGTLEFILMVFCTCDHKALDWKRSILVLAGLSIFANYPIVWNSMVDYRQRNEDILLARSSVCEMHTPFINAVREELGIECIDGRILYVAMANEALSGVNQRILRYMLQPQTVAYLLYTADIEKEAFINNLKWELHAMNCKYIYISDVPDGCKEEFSDYANRLLTVMPDV